MHTCRCVLICLTILIAALEQCCSQLAQCLHPTRISPAAADGWSELNRGQDGKILASKERFPSGIQHVADYVHSKGTPLTLMWQDTDTIADATALKYAKCKEVLSRTGLYVLQVNVMPLCSSPNLFLFFSSQSKLSAEALKASTIVPNR